MQEFNNLHPVSAEGAGKAKVLVVGGGGRCHAIVDALSRSEKVGKIYCAPGNAGIAAQAECVPIKDTQVPWDAYLAALKKIGYDGFLTIERECGDNPEGDIRLAQKFLLEKLS